MATVRATVPPETPLLITLAASWVIVPELPDVIDSPKVRVCVPEEAVEETLPEKVRASLVLRFR